MKLSKWSAAALAGCLVLAVIGIFATASLGQTTQPDAGTAKANPPSTGTTSELKSMCITCSQLNGCFNDPHAMKPGGGCSYPPCLSPGDNATKLQCAGCRAVCPNQTPLPH
jgi:hypothetical protein